LVSRTATSTITVVDQYCDAYRDLFPEVRTFENFKYLHIGMLSDIKRKSLPEIAKAVGLHDAQPLQNFVTDSPWSVVSLREKRLELTQKMLEGRSFKLVIDETGDKKKGNHTDYVARQYIGNLGKDEIDKADIDFPNDLLRELDEQRFTIEEKGEEVKANYPPIVIVTSNDEKDLPDAFLRRCLFYYIQFPYPQLANIVKSHFLESSSDLVEAAVKRFSQLRQKMEKGKAGKKVSTSELLDWFAVLRQFPEDEVLKQLEGEIPFPEVLLKKWEDHRRYLKYET
jgi:hypothetical protein